MKSPARARQDWHDLRQLREDYNDELLEFIGLTNFETISDCVARNQKMIERLHRVGKADPVWEKFQASAFDRYLMGWDGDWLASRGHRSRIIPQAYRVLSQQSGPIHFVSIAHPKWEIAEGKLKTSIVNAAKQWLRRRLSQIERLVAVGGFECSLRIDQKTDPYWAGHFHLVIAGASKDQLESVLTIEEHYLVRRYAKPLVIDPIGDLAARLAYSTKRVVKQSVAYRGPNGRQQRRELPLSPKHQIEIDLWLLGLRAGERTYLHGCRRHHGMLIQIGTDDITKRDQNTS